jgi:pyruvate formate lyase activating enzyme
MPEIGYIFDIKKFSINDGPGIRTTVFFKGCPLDCWWCHNPESRSLKPEKVEELTYSWSIYSQSCSPEIIGKEAAASEVFYEIEKDLPFYRESNGGATFSGGEPLLQPQFLLSLLSMCKEKDIHTAVDTSGFTNFDNFSLIYNLTDLFLFDLKIMDEEEHRKFTGVSNKVILENLDKLSGMGDKVIVRIPLIPSVNDSEENISRIINYLKEKNIRQINLLPFHNSASSKYRRLGRENKLPDLFPQDNDEMEKFKKQFSDAGFPVSIGG